MPVCMHASPLCVLVQCVCINGKQTSLCILSLQVKSSFFQPMSLFFNIPFYCSCVCVWSCVFNPICKLFSPHLKNQFTHQSVPLAIRLQAAVFVVWSDINLIFKSQVVGQSIQDINGKALVLLRFSQNVLWHHHKRLLLEGKDQSVCQ